MYGDEREVMLELSQAENSLEIAFTSLLVAERAGGDISSFVALLNYALDLYNKANLAFQNGEYETATIFLVELDEVLINVLELGNSLAAASERFSTIQFRNQLFLSIGVSIFLLVLGFVGWRQFKVTYFRIKKDYFPEVVVNES